MRHPDSRFSGIDSFLLACTRQSPVTRQLSDRTPEHAVDTGSKFAIPEAMRQQNTDRRKVWRAPAGLWLQRKFGPAKPTIGYYVGQAEFRC